MNTYRSVVGDFVDGTLVAKMGLQTQAADAILTWRIGGATISMNANERALLQERVRTLVLRHALEAAFGRLAAVSGPSGEDELIRLEHALVSTARNIAALPQMASLAAMVAVEDAIGTIRGAFDATHQRLEAAAPVLQDTPLAA